MQKVNLNNIEKLDFRSRESYKTLRTNLEFAGRSRKVFAVTSCTPNEGKTSVSFQLALSMAESGKRTVFVDADLRKSVFRSMYRVSAARYGLSHYLSGQASIGDVLYETNVPDFYAVFSGPVPPNPSELLGGEAFGLLLEYLRREYDCVVVDTPPLGSVIDGAVIAKQCDGAVMVIESGAVSYKFAQSVKDQLDKAGCSVLGVVLNKVNLNGSGYYGNYGRYYGKYYGKYYGMYGADQDYGPEEAASGGHGGNVKVELMPGAGQTERTGKGTRTGKDGKAGKSGNGRDGRDGKEGRENREGREDRENREGRDGRNSREGREDRDSRDELAAGGGSPASGSDREGRELRGSHDGRNGRDEKSASGSDGHPSRNPERSGRPARKERNANRKAAQGKIMLLDEDEMDFVTLDEEILEDGPERGSESRQGRAEAEQQNPAGTEKDAEENGGDRSDRGEQPMR